MTQKKTSRINTLPTTPKKVYRDVESYNRVNDFVFSDNILHWQTGKIRMKKTEAK